MPPPAVTAPPYLNALNGDLAVNKTIQMNDLQDQTIRANTKLKKRYLPLLLISFLEL